MPKIKRQSGLLHRYFADSLPVNGQLLRSPGHAYFRQAAYKLSYDPELIRFIFVYDDGAELRIFWLEDYLFVGPVA